jgi:hypothetical protein
MKTLRIRRCPGAGALAVVQPLRNRRAATLVGPDGDRVTIDAVRPTACRAAGSP